MLGMSSDNDEFSDDSTTDSPSGWSLNAAMTQASRRREIVLARVRPGAHADAGAAPHARSGACGNAGAADEREHRARKTN